VDIIIAGKKLCVSSKESMAKRAKKAPISEIGIDPSPLSSSFTFRYFILSALLIFLFNNQMLVTLVHKLGS
jgi:hypothetical protein